LEHPVVPDADQTLAFECAQMHEEALLQALILMRVRDENRDHRHASGRAADELDPDQLLIAVLLNPNRQSYARQERDVEEVAHAIDHNSTPVMLPPGRLRLVTKPSRTRSEPVTKTVRGA